MAVNKFGIETDLFVVVIRGGFGGGFGFAGGRSLLGARLLLRRAKCDELGKFIF